MKLASFLVCFMISSLALFAQDKLPGFGKIEPSDLSMKSCSYEPDAPAMVLFDVGEVSYNISQYSISIETQRRKRIKIFNQEGIAQADIKIPFYHKDGFEYVTKISGVVYNLSENGQVEKTNLQKKFIYTKKINDNWSEVSFALPNVKAGSVIEYKYMLYKKNSISDIEDWNFQTDIPVLYSAYNLRIPEYFDFTYLITRRQEVAVYKSDDILKGHWFIMRNIPSLKDEPFTVGVKDYLQKIDFQLAGIKYQDGSYKSFRNTWQKLIDEIMDAEWFGKQLNRNVGDVQSLKAQNEKSVSAKEKMINTYRFVQRNFNWNGSNSIGSFNGIRDAWDKKSGSTGDINLTLVNLLREENISAFPLLVSTRSNGKLNPVYPFLDQFNAVYVYAEVDGEMYILNAAEKYNPVNLYPYDVQLTNAFIVDRKNHRWIFINDDKKLQQQVVSNLLIDSTGKLSGVSTIKSANYAKNFRTNTYRSGKLKELLSSNEGIDVRIDSILVKNDKPEEPELQQIVSFNAELNRSGDYLFLPMDIFSGLGKNPFVAEKRQTDIDFGFSQKYEMNGSLQFPPGYELEELPKNVKMILPDSSISFRRTIQNAEGFISFWISLEINRPQFTVEEYDGVKEIYKRIYDFLSEQLVFKKSL